MRWLLSPSLRRFIALFLLLLDLSQEPGSALSFVSLADQSDGPAATELCTKDDFWWDSGNACADVHSAVAAVRDVIYADNTAQFGSPPVLQSAGVSVKSCYCTIIQKHFDAVLVADTPFEIYPSVVRLSAFHERPLYRNTSLAHKRDVVLIV